MNVAETPKRDPKQEALERILSAAELEFAERGFDGAGMKALAARAGVSQSLLHYHFGSKDKLYAAVIENRSSLINRERLSALGGVDLKAPDGLAGVFRALFLPALGPAGGGRAYARIFAGLIAGNERDQALVQENYDQTARAFIAAIETCLPQTSTRMATRIYLAALGVLATGLSRDGRAERLSGDICSPAQDDAFIETLIRFAVGGAKAIGED